jgi:mannan endo-1,4-beta-mannosidase
MRGFPKRKKFLNCRYQGEVIKMRKKILSILLIMLFLVFSLYSVNIETGKVYAAPSTAGIKGVNNPHIWYDSQAYSALDTIKSYGFNTVRIVWQTNGSGSRLKQIIDRCKALGLKPIPELHDVTGGTNPSDIDKMVNYWISIKSYIPSDVWINIANEWGPANSTTWRDTYINAVKKLRNNGISNTLVIDSGGWGQDQYDILNYALDILNADPNKNVVFSIHMYGEWNDNNKIYNFLTTCKNKGIPILVGEFGYNYNNGNNNLGCKVDASYLIQTCKSLGIGYIAWSWCGNNSENAWLDMTQSDWKTLTYWGNLVKNDGVTSSSGGTSSSGSIVYDFEGSTQGWTGENIAGGPWAVTEWKYNGSYSLKADITLKPSSYYYLKLSSTQNLSGKSSITAYVKHASWGNVGSGMQAKIYVKTGSSYTWYDGGVVSINSSSATKLTLSLNSVNNLSDVREIGIQFLTPSNCGNGESSAVYVDYVVIQ